MISVPNAYNLFDVPQLWKQGIQSFYRETYQFIH